MREDLNKLLCERERSNSSERFHPRRRAKKFVPRGEDGIAPLREGMAARYGYDTKSFGENLQPLLGQVRKAVGRRWDAFYSDLAKNFDLRSVINQHILVHLDQYVERDIFVVDGQLFIGGIGGKSVPLRGSSVQFYVDPRDGIIKRNKHRVSYRAANRARVEAARREQAAVFRQLDDGSVLHKIGDVWFHCTIENAPIGGYVYEKPANKDLFKPHSWSKETTWERLRDYEKKSCGVKRFVGATVRDALTGESVYSEQGRPPVRYHATKRTASHKMLKQAGIVE